MEERDTGTTVAVELTYLKEIFRPTSTIVTLLEVTQALTRWGWYLKYLLLHPHPHLGKFIPLPINKVTQGMITTSSLGTTGHNQRELTSLQFPFSKISPQLPIIIIHRCLPNRWQAKVDQGSSLFNLL